MLNMNETRARARVRIILEHRTIFSVTLSLRFFFHWHFLYIYFTYVHIIFSIFLVCFDNIHMLCIYTKTRKYFSYNFFLHINICLPSKFLACKKQKKYEINEDDKSYEKYGKAIKLNLGMAFWVEINHIYIRYFCVSNTQNVQISSIQDSIELIDVGHWPKASIHSTNHIHTHTLSCSLSLSLSKGTTRRNTCDDMCLT